MRLALVQQRVTGVHRADVDRGIDAVRDAAARGAQVIAFAELAFEPFYPRRPAGANVAELAEPIPGPTVDAFAALAAELGVVIMINLFELDADGLTYDTSPVLDADGVLLGRTRMVHITDYENFHEQGWYAPGDRGARVYDTRHGRIGVEEPLEFAGESFVCGPDGRVLTRAGRGTDEILLCDLDLDRLADAPARRLFLRDRRPELYADWLGD